MTSRPPPTRAYDRAFAPHELADVYERRISPTGSERTVKATTRGYVDVLQYPWDALRPGDYFLVPIGDRRPAAMRVRFTQVATRRDIEIAITNVLNKDNVPCIRVTLTFVGIRRIKLNARNYHNVSIAVPDGRWKTRLTEWRQKRRASGFNA